MLLRTPRHETAMRMISSMAANDTVGTALAVEAELIAAADADAGDD